MEIDREVVEGVLPVVEAAQQFVFARRVERRCRRERVGGSRFGPFEERSASPGD